MDVIYVWPFPIIVPKNIPIEVLNNCYKNLKRYINNGLRKHTLRFNKIETNEP